MKHVRALAAASTVAVVLACGGPAHADAQAEEYFQQGKAAMARHEYAKACSLFEASKSLEDTLGTLLNLADCHQQAGKIATAWSEFTEAEQRARSLKPPREERAVFAHDRAEALKKMLPRIKLNVPAAVRVEGFAITIDGKPVPAEAWDVGVPVDPGKRKISATAPGKVPWSTEMSVDPVEGESLLFPVDVAALKDAPKVVAQPKTGSTDATEIEAVATARARRTAGYVLGGIGVAGLAVGGIMGGLGFAAIDDERNACKRSACYIDATGTKSRGYQTAESAKNNATTDINVASIAGGVGLAALGVGIYLIVTSSPKVAPKTAIAPAIGPGHQGLSVLGEF